MGKYSKFMILMMGLISNSAFSGAMGPVTPQKDWTWLGTFSLGPVWGDGSATQTFYLAPDIEKTYVGHKSSNALADFELFLGVQRSFTDTIQWQLGIAGAATTATKLSGVIWDDADPSFDNFSYNYKIQHSHVALKGKLLADMNYIVIPWVSGSIGVGFNYAYSFDNNPLIFEAIKNPNFSSNTQTTFTYTVGAGIQKVLTHHWQIGAGYEFADWGKSKLGRAEGQTLNSGLTLNHFYTNGLLFNVTYIA